MVQSTAPMLVSTAAGAYLCAANCSVAGLAMLTSEARLAARLHHPNIVNTYEVGEQDGSYFIAMEYLEGQPLNRILKNGKAQESFTPAMWCHVFAEALAGLHHAHEQKDFDGKPLDIVHRDLSPHNIFVTYSGETKLVDFGIAKASVNTTSTATGITQRGDCLATSPFFPSASFSMPWTRMHLGQRGLASSESKRWSQWTQR